MPQAAFFVTVRPFSKNLYRRINRVVAELLWLELVWLVDWWAGVEVLLSEIIQKLFNFWYLFCVLLISFNVGRLLVCIDYLTGIT